MATFIEGLTGKGVDDDGYIISPTTSFTAPDEVFALQRYSDCLFGDTFKIEYQKKIGGLWIDKSIYEWTNTPGYSAIYQYSSYNMTNADAGDWRVYFSGSDYPGGPYRTRKVHYFTVTAITVPRRIIGYVKHILTNLPIMWATVEFMGKTYTTGTSGYYEILDPAFMSGPLNCTAPGYDDWSDFITAPFEGDLTVEIKLSPTPVSPPEGRIVGTVQDSKTFNPIEGATITFGPYSTSSTSTGYYELLVPASTTAKIIYEKSDYITFEHYAITVNPGDDVLINATLDPAAVSLRCTDYEIFVKNTGDSHDIAVGVSVFGPGTPTDENWIDDLPWFVIKNAPANMTVPYGIWVNVNKSWDVPSGTYYFRSRVWKNYEPGIETGSTTINGSTIIFYETGTGKVYGETPGDGVFLDQHDNPVEVK